MLQHQTVWTISRISDNIEETPEGFLLCKDVPAARTGEMIYGPDETPVPVGPDGLVRIYRDEQTVFDEKTIQSFVGKSVTNDHPDDDVTPDNWKRESIGVALNVRRGEGDMSDMLLMDLLIQDSKGIELIKLGKREISLGYDADYEYDDDQPGIGYQRNIIGNHIALVDQGRCGPRCAIKDKKLNIGVDKMSKHKKSERGFRKVLDLLFRARKATDEELQELANEAMDSFPDETAIADSGEGDIVVSDEIPSGEKEDEIHIHMDDEVVGGSSSFTDEDIQGFINQNAQEHSDLWAAINEIKSQIGLSNDSNEVGEGEIFDSGEELNKFIEDEMPENVTKDQIRKTKDSVFLIESFRNVVASAEILVPGIRVPTCDKADRKSLTAKRICTLRKTALDLAYNSVETRPLIDDILNGKTFDSRQMTCDAIRTLFNSAVVAKKAINNNVTHDSKNRGIQSGKTKTVLKITTIAELNEFNRQKYSQK